MRATTSALCVAGLFALSYTSAFPDESRALSTSNLIPVDYLRDGNGSDRVESCSEGRAIHARSYVSIDLRKLRVWKSDGFVRRLFDNDRRAFPVVTFTGSSAVGPLSISKVGTPRVLREKDSQVDVAGTWNILSATPWTIEGAKLRVRIGYMADSRFDSLINAFNSITASIPDHAATTSVTLGLAVTSAFDNHLFGQGRALDLLNSERDFPLTAGDLCDGYFAIFAAENTDLYAKYEAGDVVWNERAQVLQFNGDEPIEVSYGVVQIRVDDRYYVDPVDSLNDRRRLWALKYIEVQSGLAQLTYLIDRSRIDSLTERLVDTLTQAKTLLNADVSLIQVEREEIHAVFASQLQEAVTAVRSRISVAGAVTEESTRQSIAAFIDTAREAEFPVDLSTLESINRNPEVVLHNISPEATTELADYLDASLYRIEVIL